MLELKEIKKTYETAGEKVYALKGIDLCFSSNEFVSILGSSGCGKTTLLNIMGGLDHYTSGDLVINGVSTKEYDDSDWDAYRNNSIGFVFQSYNLIPHQTVLSNVELSLTLSGVSAEERKERAVAALEKVGLADQLNKKPYQMSGGQMQRVAIARALINNPDILLADEPTGALDSDTSLQIMELLKEIAEDRLVIMVTHNPELAEAYSNRIVRLKDGLVVDDTRPYKAEPLQKEGISKRLKNRSMSMRTALGLSFNNLMTKKARTLLTAFAGSIGIIGIALILSVSSGFQNYIDKIENDTLSSYPLTIQSEAADMSSLMSSLMEASADSKKDRKSTVKENQIMGLRFASVGTNDLKSFKKHVEKNESTVESYTNDIVYSYGVTPQIFARDTKYGVLQVNPSVLVNTMMGSMMSVMSTMGAGDICYPITDNAKHEQEKYTVAYGKWPEKYNELVLVLDSKNSMSDLMSYSLGLRNPKEMTDMITDIMSGKEVDFDADKPLEWTYKDLAKLEFSLVDAADMYQYDSGFDVYKSKMDDEDYMANLVKNGEKLKITCIAYPNKDNAGGMVSSGIGYLPSLTDHVIENSKDSAIVKKQLAEKDVDVFSGKTFKSIKEKTSDGGMGFENLISIDEAQLASAFGGKVSQEDMMKIVRKYSKRIEGNITADISSYEDTMTKDLAELCTSVNEEILSNVKDEDKNEQGFFSCAEDDIDKATAKVLASKDFPNRCSELAKMTGGLMNTDAFAQMLSPMISGYSTVIKQTLQYTGGNTNSDYLSDAATNYSSNEQVLDGITKMSQTITEGIMKATILTDVGKLTGEVTQEMAKAFNVDPSKIASAFKFNMSEDDIADLISAMTSTGTNTTLDSNLRKLGYANYSKPTSISFYLKDFQTKEDLVAFIDNYNKDMEASGNEEAVISYTDITGVMMKSVKTITNAVSYVLIAFVAISLIVSSIMIGIITYISVLERTKEIGVLRAIGASKKDIARVFNSETIVVGLCAGLIGIAITLLLLIPINIVLIKLTGIAALKAKLPAIGGIVLVIISVLLTFIAGLIPSGMAARKDPVEALRTE